MTTPTRPGAPAFPTPPSWSGLLEGLSAEAKSLSRLTTRIERALSEVMPVSPGPGDIPPDIARPSAAILQDLQELDRLRQTLEDMGRLMMALSVQAPATPVDPLPLSTTLTLRALAGRLLTEEDRPEPGYGGDSGRLTLL